MIPEFNIGKESSIYLLLQDGSMVHTRLARFSSMVNPVPLDRVKYITPFGAQTMHLISKHAQAQRIVAQIFTLDERIMLQFDHIRKTTG